MTTAPPGGSPPQISFATTNTLMRVSHPLVGVKTFEIMESDLDRIENDIGAASQAQGWFMLGLGAFPGFLTGTMTLPDDAPAKSVGWLAAATIISAVVSIAAGLAWWKKKDAKTAFIAELKARTPVVQQLSGSGVAAPP